MFGPREARHGRTVTRWLLAIAILLAGCEPDLEGTAFRCDADHGCPSDQQCFGGRCRRKDGAVVQCGAATCAPNQMCCSDVIQGDRCLDGDDTCPGDQALCDEPADCAEGERCCNGKATTACGLSCPEDEDACVRDADCPGDAPHCCAQVLRPWKVCSEQDC